MERAEFTLRQLNLFLPLGLQQRALHLQRADIYPEHHLPHVSSGLSLSGTILPVVVSK